MRHLKLILREDGKPPEEIAIEIDGARYALTRGGATDVAEVTRLPDGRLSLILEDGRQVCGRVRPGGDGEVEVSTAAGRRRIALAEPLRDRIAHAAGIRRRYAATKRSGRSCPAASSRWRSPRETGSQPGALLLVLEAMKMQNEIRTVARRHASCGWTWSPAERWTAGRRWPSSEAKTSDAA